MSDSFICRVEERSPGLFCLSLRGAEPRILAIIAVENQPPRIYVVPERPKGDGKTADDWMRGLREKLLEARLVSIRQGAAVLELLVCRNEHSWILRFGKNGAQVEEVTEVTNHGAGTCLIELEALAPSGIAELTALHGELLLLAERRRAKTELSRFRKKLSNRICAISKDSEGARIATQKAERAKLFVPLAARAPRGTTSLCAIDYTLEGPAEQSMCFSPEKSPLEQIQAVFTRAKRLNKGEPIRKARAKEAQDSLDEVDLALMEIDETSSVGVVRAAYERSVALLPSGLRPPSVPALSDRPERRVQACPFRSYLSVDGFRLLVGRDARGNDQLVTRVARPHDIWLHARGYHGAHVVIVVEKGRVASSESLVDAATLAAHFCDGRGQGFLEVGYSERRHVRKPKGAPAGLVSCSVEKVIGLRFEAERLQRLLRSENATGKILNSDR